MLAVCALAAELPQLVLLIIDGAGTNHFEAARLVEHGGNGDSAIKLMDRITLLSTQNSAFQLTDSAAAATAMACGVKTLNGKMGIDENGRAVQNILEYIRQHHPEYLTGIVSKVESTHATPGSFLAHVGDRGATTALYQSILDYGKADLMIGAGDHADGMGAFRDAFKKQGYNTVVSADFKKNRNVLKDMKLPLFAALGATQLPYFIEYPTELPTLQEMTDAALEKLGSNNTPFFMMVEASLNDFGSHNNNKAQLIGEMIEADYLIANLMRRAETMPNLNLIVVADHETGGLTLSDTLQALGDDAFPLPDASQSIEVNNERRARRIDKLNAQFSTTGHSNAPVIAGLFGKQLREFHGMMQTTSDLRAFVQEFLFGQPQLTPYDGLVKNAAEDIFETRKSLYPVVEGEHDEPTGPGKHSNVIALGIGIACGIGLMALLAVVLFFVIRYFREKKEAGYQKQHSEVLMVGATDASKKDVETVLE